LRQIAARIVRLRANYLERILEADLTDGIRIRLLRQEELATGDVPGEPTLWYQEFD
jgi:hypothetical protein